jgi:acetate---CoA ligase (ADP-forming)
MRDITPMIAPRSVAVIGASSNPAKAGGMLFSNLVAGKFKGSLYPINSNATEVLGIRAYPALAEIPEQIDLVFIVVPRKHVEAAVNQCVDARARSACIITAGFAESGDRGRADEKRLLGIARSGGLLLAGPNTIGMVNGDCGMMGSFVKFPRWETGCISLFAQTGIFAGGLILDVMSAEVQRLPISISTDVGNKIDVDEIDFLHFAESDPSTKVIGIYLEQFSDLPAFLSKASALRGRKPVVVLKPARTKEGMRSSLSHTGSFPADDAMIDAALRQHGVLRADDEDDFLNMLKALAMLPKPKGNRVGIATTSGALGVLATDLVVQHDLAMAEFSTQSAPAMKSILPEWLEPANPFDFWISVDMKGPLEAHEIALRSVFDDPNVDLVLCTLLAGPTSDFAEFGGILRKLRAEHNKPVALLIYGGVERRKWISDLEGADVPVFPTVRTAVKALATVYRAYN